MRHATDPVLDRLLINMHAGRADPLPRAASQVNRATEALRAPLGFVPHGTVVSMKIEVPDNLTGRHYGLVWVCDAAAGLSPADARQQIMERLVPRFLNLTLPLPE